MMSVVDLDGRPGGLRYPVPRRSKARRGADRLVRDAHVLDRAGVVPGDVGEQHALRVFSQRINTNTGHTLRSAARVGG